MSRIVSSPNKPIISEEMIEVTGARVHNLKNLDIAIPKNKLVVITGISGSGKSSLAFDTIYAEGQRRYLETFGAYARQFVGDMERPDVDRITGLSPVIAIEQKTTSKNPRSTVGTVTEVYDFLRLLFARIGKAYSYNTGKRMVKWSEEEIVQSIVKQFSGKKISILAPLVRGRKGHYRELFEEYRKKGYLKMRIDGQVKELQPKMQVDRYVIHDIELVVDRMQLTDDLKSRLSQSVQQGLQLGKGLLFIEVEGGKLTQYSKQLMCEDTGISYEEPSPNSFSFNSPYGACPSCKGLGVSQHVSMTRVIPDPSLSISEGGIAPLGEERDAWVFKQAQELARKNKISFKTPVKDLPKKQLNLLLYGNEEGLIDEVDFTELKFDPNGPFEGVVNLLHRWYANPYSERMREWTEAYMEIKPCASCEGTRLKKESNCFRVDTHTIAQLSAMNLDNLAAWFDGVELRLDKKDNLLSLIHI